MKNLTALCCGIAVFGYATNLQAHDMSGQYESPDSKFTATYTYSQMRMSGNRDGTSRISTDEILARGFMMAPEEMTEEDQNLSIGYKFAPNLSVSASLPYHYKTMKHNDGMMQDQTTSQGIGDLKLTAKSAINKNFSAFYGVSLPTGAVDKRDQGQKLEYMMQNGSGTYDPVAGINYSTNVKDDWTLGAGASTVQRFGKNSEGYRLGNEYAASLSAKKQFTPNFATSFGIEGKKWGNVKGQDRDIDPMMMPSNDPHKQGGESVDAVIGFTATSPLKELEGISLGADLGLPLYQNLNGPQLQSDYHFIITLQKSI